MKTAAALLFRRDDSGNGLGMQGRACGCTGQTPAPGTIVRSAPHSGSCAAAMSDDEDGELAAMRRAARNAALPGAAGDRLEELRRRAAASRGGSDAYFDDGDDRRAVGPPAGSDAAHSGRGSAYARPGDDDDDDDDDDDEPVRTIHRPRSVLAALAACSLAACIACKANPKLCEMLFRPACRRRRPSLWN